MITDLENHIEFALAAREVPGLTLPEKLIGDNMNPRAKDAKANTDYTLSLTFTNEEVRRKRGDGVR